jgi:tyrosine-protein kinase Etk/Wzc
MKDSLLDVIRSIFLWKKQIIWLCLISGVVTAAASLLLLSDYYQSTTVFLAASPKLAQPGYIFGRTSTELEIYGDDFDVDRIITISQSSEVINYLIDSFNLYEHYDIDTSSVRADYRVRKQFTKLYDVRKNKNEAIELSVEDKDSRMATRIANAARNKIDGIGRRLIKESHQRLINAYRSNFTDFDQKIKALTDSLQIIQKKYGIYNIESQSETYSRLIATAESRLAGEKAKLSLFQGMSAVPRDSLNRVKSRVASLEDQLKVLNKKLQLFNEGMSDVQVMKDELTELGEKRSTTIFLFNQLQAAYNSEIPSIHLVEDGRVPLIKSRPKRSLIVLGTVFLAFVFAVLMAIIVEGYKSVNWKEILSPKKEN